MKHFVPWNPRCLSDEQIGTIQHLKVDKGWSSKRLAKTYRVSVGTICRAVKAIPESELTLPKKWRSVI